MRAILLAADRSTNTDPLTVTKPKALIKVVNRSLIQHHLDLLQDHVDEIIIVVGYQKKMLMVFVGLTYQGVPVKYVEVDETWDRRESFEKIKPFLNNRFIIINGHDLHHREDIQRCIKYDKSILVGSWDDGTEPIPDMEHDVVQVHSEKTVQLPYAWSFLDANEAMLSSVQTKIEGIVEPNATLIGEVIIGKGSTVKNGAYLEGPVVIGEDCVIGPNCYIRTSTVIGHNCKIGHAVEIKNSIIGDHVSVAHLSYLGDSIVGDHVNVGAGTISANVRHDYRSIETRLDDRKIDTKRDKFGVIIGDHVHTGINTSFYPGRKIWPYLSTLPAEVIQKDRIQ